MTAIAAERWPWERSIRDDPEATGNRLFVALTVGTHIHNGLGSPGVALISRQTGLCDRAVRKHMKWLEQRGWWTVAVPHRRGRTATLAVTIPVHAMVDDRHAGAAQAVDDRHAGAAPSVRSSSRSTTTRDQPVLASVADEPVGALIDRLDKRLYPRGPDQARDMAAVLDRLLAAGWTDNEIIEHCHPLPARVFHPVKMLVALIPEQPPGPARQARWPAWCGSCHETTRLLELEDGRVQRCPDCHPGASVAVAR